MCEIIPLPSPLDHEEREVLRAECVRAVTSLSDGDLVEVLKWLEAIAEEEAEKARQRAPAVVVPFRVRRDEDHAPSA